MVRVKDTKTFIEKARIKHGDKYNYDKTVYNGSAKKLTVTCPEHGDFELQANQHVNIGGGCQKCSSRSVAEKLSKNNLDERKKDFVNQAVEKWGNKYDYSDMGFQSQLKRVKITCPDHGPFFTTPNKHLRGDTPGCPGCTIDRWSSRFINSAKEKYGDVYDYSSVEYVRTNVKVKIFCTKHKEYFWVTPRHHLNDNSCCILCNEEKRKESKKESLLRRATEVHEGKYDYSLVEYSSRRDKVKIVCPDHGEFEQDLYVHANGSGCQRCNMGGYKGNPNSAYGISGYYGTDASSNIYLVDIGGIFVKVGVAKEVSPRLSSIKRETGEEVSILGTWEGSAKDLFKIEQEILHKSNFEKYEPEIKFVGSTECFQLNEKKNIKEYIENKITKEINHEQFKV